MTDKKLTIGLIVVTFLILGGGIYVLSSASSTPAQITASQNAKAQVPERTFDWGNIPYSGGNATKTFTIKNTGSDPLKLSGVKTSCTCTKAQVIIDGKTSPYFSMHSSSAWVGEVAPGKEARFKVALNTHSVELSYDLLKVSSLSDDKGNSLKPLSWSGGSGGHHLNGELVFPSLSAKAKSAKLVITNISGFDRSFTWNL